MQDSKNSPSDDIGSADASAGNAEVSNDEPETYQAYQQRTGSESLESPPQDAVSATGPIVSNAAVSPSPEVHVSGSMAKLYRSHLRTVLIVGSVALILLIAGILALLLSSKHHPKPQTPHTKSATQTSPSGRTLTINSNLHVTQNTTIEKDLTVNGTTTLQGMVVKADATVGGNLTVQGNGNFTGSISAANFNGSNLTVTGNSNFSGNLTVGAITGSSLNISGNGTFGGTLVSQNFQGNFIGNGSQITNINASSCSDCVKLQTTNITAQTGSISLNGDAIIAGTLSGRKLNIRPATDDTSALSIQDANGANVLAVDTINHHITTGDLLPQTPGALTAGTLTPGVSFGTAVADAGQAYNDNDHWVAMGSDGFLRIAYVDQNLYQVKYVRCENKNCSQNVTTVIDDDSVIQDGFDSASIALDDAGNPYISYVHWNYDDEMRLVHCLDQDCTNVTNQVVGIDADYAGSVTVTGDGNAAIAYDSYNYHGTTNPVDLRYVHCTNADCSAKTVSAIDSHPYQDGNGNNIGEYYQVGAITTDNNGFARVVYADVMYSPTSVRTQKYIRCLNLDCTSKVSASFGEGKYYSSIAVGSDGLARIVYEGPDYSDLTYVLCNDPDCSSTTATLITDELDDTPDIALDANNLARISYDSYFDNTDHLMYVQCLNATCSQNNQKTLASDLDYSNSIALDSNGLPQMAYFVDYDVGNTWTDSLNVVSLATIDGSDLRVPGAFTAGTNIGDANNLFGQIYGQGVHLQTASSSAALVINQVGVKGTGSFGDPIDEGSGPIAQFQINGTTRAEFDQNGTLLMNGIGTSDLANFQINGQSVFKVDQNGTLALQPQDNQIADLQQWQASNGAVKLGVNSAGQFYAPLVDSQNTAAGSLTIDKTGLNVVDASSVTQASLTSDGSLQLGPAALDKYKYSSLTPNTGPWSSVALDVNGDGRPDIISDGACNWISVFINQGSGNFAAPQNYPASGCHYHLATADFNGDGHPDIAVPDSSGYVGIMFNNGDGTFANAVTYVVGTSPQSSYASYVISAADLNGDGHPDLAGTTLDGYEVIVLLNNGDGTFGAPTEYVINQNLSYCDYDQAIADFNGDGHPDILSESCQTTILLTNNGDGTFGAPTTVGNGGYGVAIADFNGDGHPDFVTSNGGIGTNNGAGTFTLTDLPNRSCGSYNVSASDVDGDGHPDISYVNNCNGRIETFISNANGTFAAPKETVFPGQQYYVWGLTYADLLGTGLQIPIIADYFSNHINLILPKLAPKLQVSTQDPAGPDVVLVGTKNQSGDFLRVQDSSQNILSRIDVTGALSIGDNGGYSLAGAYTRSTIPFAPATLTNAATTLNMANNTMSNAITIPFPFTFYSQAYSSLYIASDGFVTFLPGQNSTGSNSVTLPNTGGNPTGLIAAYMEYLNIANGGTIKYETQGTAPNRTFIIEYNNIQAGFGSYHVTTQIQLHEGSNNIDIQTTNAGPYWCATQGIESPGGKYATFDPARNNTCFTASNDGVRFTYDLPANFTPTRLSVINNDGTSVGELIKAAAQQTADLLQFQDANGNVTTRVDNLGNITTPQLTTDKLSISQLDGKPTGDDVITPGGLNVSWYNSDSGTYKTVGSGTLAYQGTDGPINWPNLGNSRPAGVNGDYINSRWTGWIKADYTETYTFYTASDDGSRLYINNQLVVNNWFDQGVTERSGTVAMTAGQWVPITVEFYQGVGGAAVTASWSSPSVTKALIPADHFSSITPPPTLLQVVADNTRVSGTLTSTNNFVSTGNVSLQNSAGSELLGTNASSNNVLLLGGTGNVTGAWQSAATLPITEEAHTTLVSNGYMYVIGGNSFSGGYTANVYYAKLNADGTTGSWTQTASLPAPRQTHASVAANGYLYVIAGDQNGGGGRKHDVFYAKVNSDGTLTSWQTAANSFPYDVDALTAVTYNSYVYVIGGTDGSNVSVSGIKYAHLNSDGSVGTWQSTTSLPSGISRASAAIVNGYVYVAGGCTDGMPLCFSPTTAVYFAKINANGTLSSWQSTVSLPAARHFVSAVGANGNLYILGGGTAAVIYAHSNQNGTLGSWQTNPNALPQSRQYQAAAVANGYVYVVGGSGSNTVYYASLSRVQINGNLDLVGVQGGVDTNDENNSAAGGSITAGNITGIGTLRIQGDAIIGQNLQVGGSVTIKASGSTNDLLVLQDTNGSVVAKIDASGNLTTANLITTAAGTNYIPDPTFANGIPLGRGTGTRQALTGQAGTATGRAIKITPNNDWTTIGENCAIPANGTYTMSFTAWTDGGSVPLALLDGPGTGAGNVIVSGATPQRYSSTWSHGASCNSFEIGPSSGTAPVYIADWQVEAGSAATSFIYGDKGYGYAWTGAANNSTSTRTAGLYVVASEIFSQGNLTVKSATFNGTLTVNGHVVTGNTTGSTTATLSGNAGTGGSPACTVSGNDTSGQITLKTGTAAWAAGTQCTINFSGSYAGAPHPVVTPAANVDTSAVKVYVTSTTTGFTISFIVADTAQHTFVFNYFNAQ